MDNLTHTLIGVAFGEAASRREVKPRMAAIYTAVLGSNLPDFDFLLQYSGSIKNLAYLLHHRGITHSILMAAPLGVFSAWIGAKLGGLSGKPSLKLCLLGVISVLFHILADFCNNYGVHPFTPFWNRWYYGDFIFIVEPLFYFVFLPFVYFTAQSRIGKGISLFLQILFLGIILSQRFTPPVISLFVCVWAVIFNWIQSRTKSFVPVCVGALIILGCFGLGSYLVREKIIQDALRRDQSFKVVQLATSPAPANPLCWTATLLGLSSSSEYVARSGTISLLPALFPPMSCSLKVFQSKNEQLANPQNLDPAILWAGEFKRPIGEFRSLAEENCFFKAFLKFSRIPVWYNLSLGRIAEDLRYSRGNANGFASLSLDMKQECPYNSIFWEPPTNPLR